MNYGSAPCDLLNISTEQFMQTNVSGAVALTLPADTAAVVVVIPANAAIGTQGTRMYANGHIVDYRYSGLDTDGDGLPDWWETRYFGNLTNASPTAMAACGYDYIDCYRLGVSPFATNVFGLHLLIQPGNGRPQLTWPSIGGKTYNVCVASLIGQFNFFQLASTNTETNVAIGLPGAQTYVDTQSVFSSGSSNRFYRIQLRP